MKIKTEYLRKKKTPGCAVGSVLTHTQLNKNYGTDVFGNYNTERLMSFNRPSWLISALFRATWREN